jgi:glycosyltransferase involved in cell wall biosynthesis
MPRRLSFFLPNLVAGGAERVALTQVEWFLEHGCEIDLVLARATGELLELLPKEVAVFDLKAKRLRKSILPLARYLRERQPDAIQAFMWPLTCYAVVARRLSGCKSRLILSDHTTLSLDNAHFGPSRRTALRHSVRRLYPLADARISVSSDAADDLSRLTGIDRQSLTVIYNPVSRPRQRAWPADDCWSASGARLLTVGKLKPVKNHRLLLEAFADLATKREAQLMIVGDGALADELMNQAAELGITDRLIMPGLVLDPWPYYASADLFVLSSDYEGYPVVLVEALLSGLNAVSTDCRSGPREILDGGRFGRVVPVGDAKSLAEAMAEALDRPLERQSLERRADELCEGSLEAYREIMIGDAGVESASQIPASPTIQSPTDPRCA